MAENIWAHGKGCPHCESRTLGLERGPYVVFDMEGEDFTSFKLPTGEEPAIRLEDQHGNKYMLILINYVEWTCP